MSGLKGRRKNKQKKSDSKKGVDDLRDAAKKAFKGTDFKNIY